MKPHNQGLAIDEIFLALGWRGRYWQRQFVAAMLPVLSCALHVMSVVFIGRTVEHRCAPVGSLNISLQYGDLTFTYDVMRNDSEFNFTVQYESCTTDVMNGTDKIYSTRCIDGYEFMEPKDASIVSQWDLVCDREALSDVSQTLLSLGQMAGAFCFTYVADRYGRKPVFVVAHLSLFIIGAAIAFSPNVITFLILRFFLGGLQQGTGLTATIILVEMLPAQRRALPSQFGCIFWPFSLLFLCFLAYITKHLSWQYSELVFAAFSIFAIFQWWTSDESLRWLIANNKREEAERIVKKAAKLNNVDFKKMKTLLEQALQEKQEITSLTALNDVTNSNHVTGDHSTQLVDNNIRNGDGPTVVTQGEDKMRLMAFFKNRHIIKITLLSSYFWLTDSVAYYGMLLTSASLTDDIYLGFVLNVAAEIPAGVAFIVLIDRIGRKRCMYIFHILAALALVVSTILDSLPISESIPGIKIIMLCINLLGKFAVTTAFATLWQYTPELYPTNLRNTGFGMSSLAARIGGMVAPYSRTFGRHISWGPGAVFACLCLFVPIFLKFLPETHGHELPQTIDDMEEWLNSQRKPKRPKQTKHSKKSEMIIN